MAINSDLTIEKGDFNVTVFTTAVTENSKNKLQKLDPIQAAAKQSLGPKKTKVVDLLRISETFVFGIAITEVGAKSALVIKNELKSIQKGAGVDGGTPATLTYEDTSFNVYIEDLVIKKNYNDNAVVNYDGDDSVEYIGTITLIVGEEVS